MYLIDKQDNFKLTFSVMITFTFYNMAGLVSNWDIFASGCLNKSANLYSDLLDKKADPNKRYFN